MTTGEPNKDKLVHFIAKIWDPVAKAYKPIYTAPDATDTTYGDVLLSDATDSELDAATGVTAASPKAVKKVNDNANTKLSKVSTDPQEVTSKVTFKDVNTFEKGTEVPTGEFYKGNLQGNADTATKIKTPINLNTQSGSLTASGKVLFDGSTDVTIPIGELDATQLKGIIPLDNLPQGALERVVNYTILQDAIDAYTTADKDNKPFQEGDTIRVTGNDGDTPVMYAVIGDPTLPKNYVEYAAATATNALSADQALKLTTDAGNNLIPVYFENGIPKRMSENLTIGGFPGGGFQPVYFDKDNGFVTPGNHTIGTYQDNNISLLSFRAGVLNKTSESAGHDANEENDEGNLINAYAQPIYVKKGRLTPLTNTTGSEKQPVYFDNGFIKPIDFTIERSVPIDAKFTDTTYDVFKKGTETTDPVNGLVPAPTAEQAGQDLCLRSDGSWGTVGGDVTGVKGNRESIYRKGDVNLTAENVGAVGLTIPNENIEPTPDYSWDTDYFWSRHVTNTDDTFFGLKVESISSTENDTYEISLDNWDLTSGDNDIFKVNGQLILPSTITDGETLTKTMRLSIKSNKNIPVVDINDKVGGYIGQINNSAGTSRGFVKLSAAPTFSNNNVTLQLIFEMEPESVTEEGNEPYTWDVNATLNTFIPALGIAFNDDFNVVLYKTTNLIPEGNNLETAIVQEYPVIDNTTTVDGIQTMQGIGSQLDGPIKTTKGGLLPNGINTQLGNIDNPFKDVYTENVYADYIYLSEGGLNEIVNGDFTVANANKLKQTITFTGDINATVDLSTMGNKTINVRVAPEIAIQNTEPTEDSVKLWIKI